MMAGQMMIREDPDGSLIRVTGRGQFTADGARDHFVTLERAVRAMRQRRGCARILVDLGDNSLQTADVASIVHEESSRICGPGDLVAILCHSMLQTLQMRRNGPQDRKREFPHDREADAIQWLLGESSAKDDDRTASNA